MPADDNNSIKNYPAVKEIIIPGTLYKTISIQPLSRRSQQ